MAATQYRRSKAMRMLRSGAVSVTEAAQIALVSRQRVREWCETAGIDPAKARKDWMATVLAETERKDRKCPTKTSRN